MAEGSRSDVVQRLLAERRAKAQATTLSPSSSECRAERYRRIQKLLGERRAKHELEGCDEGNSHSGLLSPGSTAGARSEAQASMAHYDDMAEPWALMESTPGGPRLEYTLGESAPLAARQYSGDGSSRGEDSTRASTSRSTAERRGLPGPGQKAGGAMGTLTDAIISPRLSQVKDNKSSNTLIAAGIQESNATHALEHWQPADAPCSSACRQLDWDACSPAQESDGASAGSQQHAASPRAEADMHSSSSSWDRATKEGPEEKTLREQYSPYAARHAHPTGQAAGSHGPGSSDEGSMVSGQQGRPQAAKAQKSLKDKLFEALRGAPEGPIELDPAMLYSPASSAQPPSSRSGASAEASPAARPGARSTPQRRQTVTKPREFRLSSARPSNSRAATAQRILAGLRKQSPFRPRQHARAGSGPSEAGSLDGEARIARLAQPRMQLWEKCAQRKQQEQSGELAECSFAPRTGRGPVSGPRATAARLPAPARLYANHSSKYMQWDRLRAEQEKEELQECTFAPEVKGGQEGRAPLHRRLDDLQRQRRERMVRLQAAAQPADAAPTFAPAVNERSARLALSKQIRELLDEVPAFQRLGAARRRPPRPDAEGNQDLTFAPVVNANSTRLLEDSTQVPGSFLQRQRFFHDLKLQRMRVLHSEEGPECTFSPKTEDQSKAILEASSHAGWLDRTPEAQLARLAVADKERVEGARAAAAHAYYSQFTFQPAINSRSKQLKRDDRLADLASDDARRARLEAIAASVEMERGRECTFKPVLSCGTARRLADQENTDPADEGQESRQQRQEEAKRRRQAALEELRTQRQNRELAECSFAPAKPPRPPPAPKGPVRVPGLERYMAAKQRARQLAEEQQAREAKAFLQNPKARLEPCTVPQPFALQTELRELETANRRAQLQARILAASMRECTFQPKTNESINRELLKAIIEDSDVDPLESIASASTV